MLICYQDNRDVREEEHLDGDGEPGVEDKYNDEDQLRSLMRRSHDDWV